MKGNLRKCSVIILSTAILGVGLPSSLASAKSKMNSFNHQSVYNTAVDKDNEKAIKAIVKEVRTNAHENKLSNQAVEPRGIVSIGSKLIKIFGKSYVKEKLPKIIYSKLPSLAKEKISESAFVGGWNT